LRTETTGVARAETSTKYVQTQEFRASLAAHWPIPDFEGSDSIKNSISDFGNGLITFDFEVP